MRFFKHTQIASRLPEVLLRATVILHNGLVAKSDLQVKQQIGNPQKYEEKDGENNYKSQKAVFSNIGGYEEPQFSYSPR